MLDVAFGARPRRMHLAYDGNPDDALDVDPEAACGEAARSCEGDEIPWSANDIPGVGPDSTCGEAAVSCDIDAPRPPQWRCELEPFVFNSNFECGSMGPVELLRLPAELLPGATGQEPAVPQAAKKSSASQAAAKAGAEQLEDHYVVTASPDCVGSPHESRHRSWFFFSTEFVMPSSTTPAGNETQENTIEENEALVSDSASVVSDILTVWLAVRGLTDHTRLFRQGHRPWVKAPEAQWQKLVDTPAVSFGHTYDLPLESGGGGTGFMIRWKQKIRRGAGPVFFAFSVPFGYTECQQLVDRVEHEMRAGAKAATCVALRELSAALYEDWVPKAPGTKNGIYFHRQALETSLEGRTVDLLTLTAAPPPDAPAIDDAPPLALEVLGQAAPPRLFSERPVAFFSARVHPGETPAQFTFFGLFRFLLSGDPRAVSLRNSFTFKLVPMLNPDGVARGHFRTNSRGLDLNRCYEQPCREEHESIWAVKQLLLHWAAQERLLLYVDIHAHPSRQGCFLLMNRLADHTQAWNMCFARLYQLNSPHFDLGNCDFEDPESEAAEQKQGCGRSAIHKACGLRHAYTLECNFNGGLSTNRLSPAFGLDPQSDECPGARYIRPTPVPYNPSCWAQVGEAAAVSLLDLYGHNCCSRLPGLKSRSVASLLEVCLSSCARQSRRILVPRRASSMGSAPSSGLAAEPPAPATGDTSPPPGRPQTPNSAPPAAEGFAAVAAREKRCSRSSCCWAAKDSSVPVARPPSGAPRPPAALPVARAPGAACGAPSVAAAVMVVTSAKNRSRGRSVDLAIGCCLSTAPLQGVSALRRRKTAVQESSPRRQHPPSSRLALAPLPRPRPRSASRRSAASALVVQAASKGASPAPRTAP